MKLQRHRRIRLTGFFFLHADQGASAILYHCQRPGLVESALCPSSTAIGATLLGPLSHR